MPPKQCPNCGRFLSSALVDALPEGEQPCPGCAEPLAAGMFADSAAPDADPGTSGSIRPPDLAPSEVRGTPDVLDGWDRDAGPAEIAAWARDDPPFPTDAVAVAASAFGGAVMGAALLRRRGTGALIGGLLGALVAALVRRIWRSPD